LVELLLRLPEFALEPLQVGLETANPTLDSLDPVDWGILRLSLDRYQGCAECDHRAAVATAAAGLVIHASHPR
jgi:hypothetical protein